MISYDRKLFQNNSLTRVHTTKTKDKIVLKDDDLVVVGDKKVAILDRAHSCGVHHSSIKFVFIITHLKSIVCATPWLCLQLAFFKILNEAVTLGITKKPYQITKKNCKSGLDAYSGKFTMGYLNGAWPS